jgi:hypothetical protein
MRCEFSTVMKALSALILPMAVSVALAEGISTSFSGFGTVGGTFTSDGKYAYYHSPTEFTGASNSLDVGLESRIGVQAVISLDPQWSITAQEVAKLRGNTNFDPGTEWLFAQYQPVPDLKLRLGRVVLPVFLASDVINVGYAVPWFRAPNNVYYTEPFAYLDGGQVLWGHSLGALQLNLEATYGSTENTFSVPGVGLASAKSKSTFNAAVSLSWRDLLVRFSETRLNEVTSLRPSPTQTLNLDLHDHFHCLGLQYDNGKALLMSEWTKRDEPNLPGANKPLAQDTSWYVAAGWRFGKFTPLAIYSVLNVGDSLLTSAGTTHTWDASLRYDVMRNLDLKLQISRALVANGTYFVVSNPASNQSVNIYSFGADFVF